MANTLLYSKNKVEDLFLKFDLYETNGYGSSLGSVYYVQVDGNKSYNYGDVRYILDIESVGNNKKIETDDPNYINYLFNTYSSLTLNCIENEKYYYDKIFLLEVFKSLNLKEGDIKNSNIFIRKILGYEKMTMSEVSIFEKVYKQIKIHRLNKIINFATEKLNEDIQFSKEYKRFLYEVNKHSCYYGYIYDINRDFIDLYDEMFYGVEENEKSYYRDIILYGCGVWRQ